MLSDRVVVGVGVVVSLFVSAQQLFKGCIDFIRSLQKFNHGKIQVKFDLGNRPPVWLSYGPFFDLVFVVGLRY